MVVKLVASDSQLPLKKRKSWLGPVENAALIASKLVQHQQSQLEDQNSLKSGNEDISLHLGDQLNNRHPLFSSKNQSHQSELDQFTNPQNPYSQHLTNLQTLASCMSQCLDLRTSSSSTSCDAAQNPGTSVLQDQINSEDSQQQICMICEDKATGLHYGIITCEGCKGFFKRTVQNKRVYTCSSDDICIITKQQRNRCQSCRFQKCLRQGMVLAAVREDRMPGGRNSGAVYNMYKMKYKKHNNKKQQVRSSSSKSLGDSVESTAAQPQTISHWPTSNLQGKIHLD